MNLFLETRQVDAEGRLLLSDDLAGSTVVIERLSETEYRVRKAIVIPEDELFEPENSLRPLSDRDRDLFLAALEEKPEPIQAVLDSARKYGRV